MSEKNDEKKKLNKIKEADIDFIAKGLQRGYEEIDRAAGKEASAPHLRPSTLMNAIIGITLPFYAIALAKGVKKPLRKRIIVHAKKLVGREDTIWKIEPRSNEELEPLMILGGHHMRRLIDTFEAVALDSPVRIVYRPVQNEKSDEKKSNEKGM